MWTVPYLYGDYHAISLHVVMMHVDLVFLSVITNYILT
jgi:hypothetical protein